MSFLTSMRKLRDNLMKQTFADFVEQSALIQGNPTSSYNPATGTNVTVYAISIPGVVFLGKYRQDEIAGEIQAGDVKAILSTENISAEIQANSKIVVGSATYDVLGSEPVPKKNAVVQILHCRGVGNA